LLLNTVLVLLLGPAVRWLLPQAPGELEVAG
jgi:hypothetical protein